MSSQPTPPTADHIMQVGFGFWSSKVLLTAVEMGLFSELAQRPQRLAELQSGFALHPRAAHDFLDALVALGFLQRDDGVYRNAPDADLFLDQRKPSYIGGILEMSNRRLYGFWDGLPEALRSGLPQNELKHGGTSLFAQIYPDPALLRGFLAAMTGVSHAANCAIASRVPWQRWKTFVDVGTAQGDLAVQVALAQPHLRGVGFDLAVVEPVFAAYAAERGVADRLRFVAGDFFADPLPAADVVMMGHILHDWDLDEKRQLVRKAYEALPAGGAFVVYEALIDDERRHNAFGLLMSLNMLIETPGGFDYTGADCCGWMRDAGFREVSVEPLTGPDSMVVGIK
ncbi:MAG: methyltransferase [Candidatus Binatia bacterium]